VGLSASAEQTNPISMLLLDILMLFVANGGNRIFTRTLLAGINALPNRPWAEARRGKPVTDKWLADELRPYEIRSRTLWIGEFQGKGYCLEEVEAAFRRYFPPWELEALRAEPPPAGQPQKPESSDPNSASADPTPNPTDQKTQPEPPEKEDPT